MGNASKDLGLDQTCLEDNNLKKILSGLSSIMDRVGGALQTHADFVHGLG